LEIVIEGIKKMNGTPIALSWAKQNSSSLFGLQSSANQYHFLSLGFNSDIARRSGAGFG